MMVRVTILIALCLLSGPVAANEATCAEMLNQQAAETNRATSVLLQLSRGNEPSLSTAIAVAGSEMRLPLKAALDAHETTTASLEKLSALKHKECLSNERYESYASIYLRTLALLDPLLVSHRS